jgi:hypothetical protein
MWSTELFALVMSAFFVAGLVKGIVGFGLPVVALALLANTVGLKSAIALITVPAILMNVYQASVGGNFTAIVKRIWKMLLAACIGIWFGVRLLANLDPRFATFLLGLLLLVYATYSLTRAQWKPHPERESWQMPLMGALGGIAYGFSGSFMVPGVIYLQALGLNRNVLVQSLGIVFMLTTSALALSLSGHNMLGMEKGLLSTAALVPAVIGMIVGQRFRNNLSEERFRTIFFWALLVAGAYMILRAVL